MKYEVPAGDSASASTSGSGSASDHANSRTTNSRATTVNCNLAQEREPHVVIISNVDPSTTAEDFQVFLEDEAVLNLQSVSKVIELPSETSGDGLVFEVHLQIAREGRQLIRFFNDDGLICDGRKLSAERLPRLRRTRHAREAGPSHAGPLSVPKYESNTPASQDNVVTMRDELLVVSGKDTPATLPGASRKSDDQYSQVHPDRRSLILATETKRFPKMVAKVPTAAGMPAMNAHKSNARTSNSKQPPPSAKKPRQRPPKAKNPAAPVAKPIKGPCYPFLGVKPAFLEVRPKTPLAIRPAPAHVQPGPGQSTTTSQCIYTSESTSSNREGIQSLGELLHSTHLSKSGPCSSELPLGPEGQAPLSPALQTDGRSSRAAGYHSVQEKYGHQRHSSMEVIQTEGVARGNLSQSSSIPTYASPLAVWRNETYFNPAITTPLQSPGPGGLTVSLQTPAGPMFIPYTSFAGYPHPLPPLQPQFGLPHTPSTETSPFPAYFPPSFVQLLQSAGFKTPEDVKTSTGDLDSVFRLAQRLAVKRPDTISNFATEFSLASKLCRLLKVAPYDGSPPLPLQHASQAPEAQVPVQVLFDGRCHPVLIWAGIVNVGQLREVLDIPGSVPVFAEKLSEKRPDLLSSFRDTFHLENKLLQVLGYRL